MTSVLDAESRACFTWGMTTTRPLSSSRIARICRLAQEVYGAYDETTYSLVKDACGRLTFESVRGHDDASIARGLVEIVRRAA